MPIVFGSTASSSVVNATFLDKTTGGTVSGVLSLDSGDSGDGNSISSVQFTLNRAQTFSSSESLKANGETILVDVRAARQDFVVAGDGESSTLSSFPFGQFDITSGAEIVVIGNNDTNKVKIIDNRDNDYGCVLNGSADLGLYDVLVLRYNTYLKRFIEVGRNF